MENTIRVRIAVAVDPGGEWNAAGWGGRDRPHDPEAMRLALEAVGENAAEHWIEAELPVPPPPRGADEPGPGGDPART